MFVDPLAADFASWSPYTYVYDNPIIFTDPTGMQGESTIVEQNDDGTYRVVGAADDGDTGVYVGSKEGKKIGNSVSPVSFMNKGKAVKNAIIDLESTAGQEFLDGLILSVETGLGLYEYGTQATGGQPYDFKKECLDECLSPGENRIYQYRGGVLKGNIIASARDVGNIGAGWIAGRKGLPWRAFRLAANTLETKQVNKTGWGNAVIGLKKSGNGGIFSLFDRHQEGKPTQEAQKIGYKSGIEAATQINKQRAVTIGAPF